MIRNAVRVGCLLTLLGWAGGAVQAQTITFNLNDVTTGTQTPFSSTRGGLTATFSSPGYPSAFSVTKPGDPYLYVASYNVTGFTSDAFLDISFAQTSSGIAQALSSITMDFGTFYVDSITLKAFSGTDPNSIASTFLDLTTLPYHVHQGVIGLDSSPTTFDRVELSYVFSSVTGQDINPGIQFAYFTVNAVPEPASFIPWLLGSGSVLGYAALRKRSVRGLD